MAPISTKFTPVASPILCLVLEFDLSEVGDCARLPLRDHQAAAARACDETGLMPRVEVTARAFVAPAADLKAVQRQPVDELAAAAGAQTSPVFIDFFYAPCGAEPSLGVRVLTDLRSCDGVTAVRLALHILEVVEGGASAQIRTTAFPKNPKPDFSLWRRLKMLPFIADVAWEAVTAPGRLLYQEVARRFRGRAQEPVTSNLADWFSYHSRTDYAPADCLLFTSATNGFRDFMGIADVWRRRVGLDRGFFYLMNYSPMISSGVVSGAAELTSLEAKLDGLLAPPAPPATDNNLHLAIILSRRMMFNNYGRHSHAFAAKPTAFCWDWLNFPSTMTAAFTISINGVFMYGVRGPRANLAAGEVLLQERFGEPLRTEAVTHHPRQGWFGRAPPATDAPAAFPQAGAGEAETEAAEPATESDSTADVFNDGDAANEGRQ